MGLRFAIVIVLAGCTAAPAGTTTAAPTLGPTGQPTPGAEANVCVGVDGYDWTGIPDVVRHYGQAWNERDAEARAALVEQAFAEDATLLDPSMDVPISGRDAIVEWIGGFHVGRDGEYLEYRGWEPADEHHGLLHLRWRLCGADDTTSLEGSVFAELDDDGLVRRSVSFY